jgi:phosphatidylserine/phosphatidylglycerophosphate/cardiolipin synthase-like enzyme
MTDWLGFGTDLPWWAWTLMVIGVIAFVGVIGALFLPDWPSPDFSIGLDAEPGSDDFVGGVATFLNEPVFQGGEATLLQNGDGFYPAMLQAIRDARDTINFETYIFEPDEIGRQFIEAFKERAQAGVEVRFLIDGFGGIKLKKRYRDDLTRAGADLSAGTPTCHRHRRKDWVYRRSCDQQKMEGERHESA